MVQVNRQGQIVKRESENRDISLILDSLEIGLSWLAQLPEGSH